jgi:hypothetical protein
MAQTMCLHLLVYMYMLRTRLIVSTLQASKLFEEVKPLTGRSVMNREICQIGSWNFKRGS